MIYIILEYMLIKTIAVFMFIALIILFSVYVFK